MVGLGAGVHFEVLHVVWITLRNLALRSSMLASMGTSVPLGRDNPVQSIPYQAALPLTADTGGSKSSSGRS